MKSGGELNQKGLVFHIPHKLIKVKIKEEGFVPCPLISNCLCLFSTMCLPSSCESTGQQCGFVGRELDGYSAYNWSNLLNDARRGVHTTWQSQLVGGHFLLALCLPYSWCAPFFFYYLIIRRCGRMIVTVLHYSWKGEACTLRQACPLRLC